MPNSIKAENRCRLTAAKWARGELSTSHCHPRSSGKEGRGTEEKDEPAVYVVSWHGGGRAERPVALRNSQVTPICRSLLAAYKL